MFIRFLDYNNFLMASWEIRLSLSHDKKQKFVCFLFHYYYNCCWLFLIKRCTNSSKTKYLLWIGSATALITLSPKWKGLLYLSLSRATFLDMKSLRFYNHKHRLISLTQCTRLLCQTFLNYACSDLKTF